MDMEMNISMEIDGVNSNLHRVENIILNINLTLDRIETVTLQNLYDILMDLSIDLEEMGMSQSEMSENIMDLLDRCQQMRNETQDGFDDLMDLLEAINEIQNGLLDVQSDQQGMMDNQSLASLLDYLMILLLVAIIVILIFMMIKKRKENGTEEKKPETGVKKDQPAKMTVNTMMRK
jgi:hypothetical protein